MEKEEKQKNKQEIKAIVFDIGGVLLEELAGEARKRISKKYNLDSKKFQEFWIKNITKSYTRKMHYRDFFKKLVKYLKTDTKPSELINAWLGIRKKTSKVNKKVEKLIKNLRKRYLLVCVTNSTLLNDKVKARTNTYRLFDIAIISFHIGMRKPDLKIYKYLTKQLKKKKISPKQTVFVDDKEINIHPAKNLGIKTILFKNNSQLLKDLKKLGVDIK